MHIILTHEQADFDALASSFGAHLVDETAVPVLPRRLNRNVRAFLTLYGVELPFIDPRDLPSGPIETITLVDTQSLVSIRGVNSDTQVRVIDHHTLRDNLPPDWSITYTDTGANTTLFVEALRERDFGLTPIQSTLLLLGIYEDTGSLTYSRTTSRDLRAAAFLLEQGASLSVAANFLNHPLSRTQQDIYDQLRSNEEHFHINGHTVVIATADSQDSDEELSTIAHKLRDLLDPDALFVLVTTRGGVQMIARSTSDHIDVAEIVGLFGGGGHERAAAGLIRERDIKNVRAELIGKLPKYILPAVTVSQIMSRGPQLLSAKTSVEDAAQRMRRYGYEGYPVVEVEESEGQRHTRVLGLLTRRAVDRALAHKLNLTASSLMDAGSYTVYPDDSIEYLQQLMTDTGWGQIPVVDRERGDVIGIVTRTDLLKTLTPQPQLPTRHNLSSRLELALPPARLELLRAIAQAARTQRAALYIVGGFVRDLLLDRPSLDFDLVVEGDAIALARSLANTYDGRVTSHARFGTAKWHIGEIRTRLTLSLQQARVTGRELQPEDLPDSLDFITARTEFYTHPTALPTVERGSIKLDLHRRDFTINTLALRLDGRHFAELHDYWGGLNDLRHGWVRVLHSLSFVDDPTRILRAVRFEQRFRFHIEARTLELLTEAASLLDRVSGDRIRHEINHILVEERVAQILSRLHELNLLSAIHPDLGWDSWLHSRLEALPTKQPDVDWNLSEITSTDALKQDLAYILWFVRLPFDKAESVCLRLKLSADLTATIKAACRLWQELPQLSDASPSQVVLRLEDVPAMARYAVYLATSDIRLRKLLQQYATSWRKIFSVNDGHSLRARGLPPGPAYKRILWELRRSWLDQEIHTAEEEEALLQQLTAPSESQNLESSSTKKDL